MLQTPTTLIHDPNSDHINWLTISNAKSQNLNTKG